MMCWLFPMSWLCAQQCEWISKWINKTWNSKEKKGRSKIWIIHFTWLYFWKPVFRPSCLVFFFYFSTAIFVEAQPCSAQLLQILIEQFAIEQLRVHESIIPQHIRFCSQVKNYASHWHQVDTKDGRFLLECVETIVISIHQSFIIFKPLIKSLEHLQPGSLTIRSWE